MEQASACEKCLSLVMINAKVVIFESDFIINTLVHLFRCLGIDPTWNF